MTVNMSALIKDFTTATVGEHAYTWEAADGSEYDGYRFETAGNPQDLWEVQSPVVRKLWLLVEVTVLPAVDDEVTS